MMSLTKRTSYLFFLCCCIINIFVIPCSMGFSSVSLFPLSWSASAVTSTYLETSTSTQSNEAATTTSTTAWEPKLSSLEERIETETIESIGFHHIEFYCGDARSMANQFAVSLGMSVTGITGQSTGNDQCISYGLQSGEQFRLLLTAPYSRARATTRDDDDDDDDNSPDLDADAPMPLPNYNVEDAHTFFQNHGLAARAVGIEVMDAKKAFEVSVANGAIPVLEPTFLPNGCYISEVELYGDVVLRYVSFITSNENHTYNDDASQPFLPHLAPIIDQSRKEDDDNNDDGFGLYKIDHAVGNVPNLQEVYSHIQKFTGFHEFAEFTSEDVGTVDSGLNSVVLASDSEAILLPINEPTNGRRKSQIQTYLEQNEGPGLQHLAVKTKDIFSTVRKMRRSQQGMSGFELMKRPSEEYYKELPDRLGDQLTPTQYQELEELGILADSDEEGILMQIFTKPVGDRPTFFFELIQRIGCVIEHDDDDRQELSVDLERPGCGGFGKGNFRELFRSIEEHEKTLKV
ncbi:4-hydroxyphenylpyruvate dioxygenase [Fragilariopsis cylindrus CCMP1102]|uniref:4-hydroxyphenylpyruvate dioxygenase n=1 Tax=Fragilariopsis cylindrus CCMP1102 TaxID=635003 RepID=A0A1E7FFW9_9STRA|nr:4-hydroxyphenylpyruvate dioxygenase [Fragilariopsis cylindrus CCMP1102]|eukprot:OEU17071.1 4-hydroxyphenylpyruvate dioxygenase [Fragilariopsis cylindrus CCMP1102]